MTLYDRIAALPGGIRALAAARLRREALTVLREAMTAAGLDDAELAKRLGVRRWTVERVRRGDSNIRVDTLATMLAECGVELRVEVLPLGTQDARQERADYHRRRYAAQRGVEPSA